MPRRSRGELHSRLLFPSHQFRLCDTSVQSDRLNGQGSQSEDSELGCWRVQPWSSRTNPAGGLPSGDDIVNVTPSLCDGLSVVLALSAFFSEGPSEGFWFCASYVARALTMALSTSLHFLRFAAFIGPLAFVASSPIGRRSRQNISASPSCSRHSRLLFSVSAPFTVAATLSPVRVFRRYAVGW